jgi:hypothetical protein
MSETNVYRVTITDPDISDTHQNEIGEWYITDAEGLIDALDRKRFGVIPAYPEHEHVCWIDDTSCGECGGEQA